ncbi:MAG: Arc family DNA-binding protein [Cyclonatronaceae bacterium]
MPSITVKNIPEPIYQQLKKRAQAQHRSINSEIIACLEQSTLSHRPSPEEFLRQARKMRQQTKGSLSAQEIQKAIDQGRP